MTGKGRRKKEGEPMGREAGTGFDQIECNPMSFMAPLLSRTSDRSEWPID